ncbi:MAG: hypothetical protein CL931_15800 [Deltaproteobacteria bacterium]|nr:hypothetical protein [Deltaproteobacteria bacterium]
MTTPEAPFDPETQRARDELRAAFDDLIGELQAARDTIDDPQYFGPPATPRNLAEGYRYLAGFVHHGIERAFHEDPDYPAFRNALSIFNKSTIENSDAVYFYSPIDGRQTYRVTGRVEDARHWRGEPRLEGEPTAPQYLIFEVASGPMAGDTGTLAELQPGYRTGFGTLDSSKLQIEADGSFELILGPEKPDGFDGNFICTKKGPARKDPEGGERYADYVSGRQLFYDWQNEEPVHLSIECLDTAGSRQPALTAERAAASLRRMGSIIKGQMRFWLEFYDVVLNVKQTHEHDGRPYFMPINAYNTPNGASSDTGGGMSTNIYAGGIFDLKEDEALYIEATFTGEPVYTSIHLGNLWGESPDYATAQSSLNHHQMHMGEDGKQRWIVAHEDPGVMNWIDTTRLDSGFLSHRWAYSELPDKEDWPTITCRVVPFSEAAAQFPADQPKVSPAERAEAIRIRGRHVQKRFRVF